MILQLDAYPSSTASLDMMSDKSVSYTTNIAVAIFVAFNYKQIQLESLALREDREGWRLAWLTGILERRNMLGKIIGKFWIMDKCRWNHLLYG